LILNWNSSLNFALLQILDSLFDAGDPFFQLFRAGISRDLNHPPNLKGIPNGSHHVLRIPGIPD
jgi:hypothetical protein